MGRTDGMGGTSQQLPEAPSAVHRLEDMKEHRTSLVEDVKQHWRGWLGSLIFHCGLLVLFMMIVWPIVRDRNPEVVISAPMDSMPELTSRPIDSLLPAPYETEHEIPDLKNETPRPSIELSDDIPGVNFIGRLGPYGTGKYGPGDDGTDDRFRRRLAQMGSRGLDVVFVFDSTGSMGGIIHEVKTRIRTLINAMNYFVPGGRAQLGLVTYRDLKKYDLDDYEYTVRYLPLVKCDPEGLDRLNGFLRNVQAYGGGDIPEAVYEGVHAAIHRMKWRPESVKVIIVFGDAPPRPEENGLDRIVTLCRAWHEKTGGVITCIDTAGARRLREEFKAMSEAGGSQAVALNEEREIIMELLVSMFDREFEKDVRDRIKRMKKEKDTDEPIIRED